MLRGVNRSIIEINETDNRYFEKVIMFLKPEYVDTPPYRLKMEADSLIEKYGLTHKSEARKKRKRQVIINRCVLTAIAVSIISVILFLIKIIF